MVQICDLFRKVILHILFKFPHVVKVTSQLFSSELCKQNQGDSSKSTEGWPGDPDHRGCLSVVKIAQGMNPNFFWSPK